MEKIRRIKLNPNLIVRHEKDGTHLYNGRNGAMIRVPMNIYEKIKGTPIVDNQEYEVIWDALNREHLLDETELELIPDQLINSDRKVNDRAENRLLQLKSDLSPYNLIWALTPRCNLKCIYCFPNAHKISLSYDGLTKKELLQIADSLIDSKVCRVILSGGEALLCNSFWTVLEKLYGAWISIAVITNGILLTEKLLRRIKSEYKDIVIAVSLDAPNENINRITRGDGAFDKSLRGLRLLIHNNISCAALITLTRFNFPVLDEHIKLLDETGIDSITIQDLRLFGDNKLYDRMRLTWDQEKTLPEITSWLKSKYPGISFNFTELNMFNSDKHLVSDTIMQCPAGDNFAYIDFLGDIYPCTAFPTWKLGNVIKDGGIQNLWQNSESIKHFRELKASPMSLLHKCQNCGRKTKCFGGCRGDALYYSGDLYGLPSRCPKNNSFALNR